MSMGDGGWAKIIAEDDTMVIYEYGSYNLNEPEHRNREKISDGSIIIYKQKFSGKLYKSCAEMLKAGIIEVNNCSNCWHISEGYDYIARYLIGRIADKYNRNQEFPEYVGIDR